MKGKVVSPTTPRDTDGIYWGYTTRMASSINSIFEECPYAGGYDVSRTCLDILCFLELIISNLLDITYDYSIYD